LSGIGKELLKLYLAQPSTTVISGVRDVDHPSVAELQELPVGPGSRLIVLQIDSSSPTDAAVAVSRLQSEFSITKLDTVVANAGIGKYWGLAVDTPVKEVEDHFTVNAVGPFRLFQAVQPLLFKASTPRFVVISTILGSIELQKNLSVPDVAYGMSKAAVNFFTSKIHHENPQLVAFPIHPGYVRSKASQEFDTHDMCARQMGEN
jgi:norsolorinic acid ketoreductase